jgi:hypothetical protein
VVVFGGCGLPGVNPTHECCLARLPMFGAQGVAHLPVSLLGLTLVKYRWAARRWVCPYTRCDEYGVSSGCQYRLSAIVDRLAGDYDPDFRV